MEMTAPLLLVDDHVSNLVALEAVLAPLGQEMLRATSGEEALKHVLFRDVAVILMDVQMPGLDGLQTASLIKQRERSRHVPIIFLTAIHREPAHMFKGYEEGAVDYMIKPFEPAILRSKVAVFVELFHKQQALKAQASRLRELERTRLEKQHEQRFRALTDGLPIALCASDANGVVQFCNRHWVEYTGYDVDACNRPDSWDVVHPDDRAPTREAWLKAVAAGAALETVYRMRRHDGVFRWHQVRTVPERDERGQIIGWICTAADIDDQRRARDKAEASNHMKDEFLAMVSHELRTPLNAILGWAEMLRAGRLPPERTSRAIDVIVRNGRAQAQLIEDLLDVSRIVAGKLDIARERVDLAAIAAAAVDTVRPTALDREIKLELDARLDVAGGELEGDAHRLQQVIWNLLSNAVKFSPTGGRVVLSLERQKRDLIVRVRDSGIGIAPEFLPHVFERFRQADPGARAQNGLGLGLAIARHIVELHGGTIDAASEGEGHGAVFTVRLPASASAPPPYIEPDGPTGPITQPRPTLPAPEAPQRLDGLRVLVVDDERDARELVAEFLAQAGALVTSASSAREACELIERARFDVLVSDLDMPRLDGDGYALLGRLHARGVNVPAIAVSAHASMEDRGRALEAGFETHLSKPLDERALIELIARLRPSSPRA